MARNSFRQFIFDQKDKNQMKLIWCTLNFFGNNKAKKVILLIQNYIFKCIHNLKLLCLLKIDYFFELSSNKIYFVLNFANSATN
jgi:hypothetical protein